MDVCVPEEIEEILEHLPNRVALRVPHDVLQTWFSCAGRRDKVEQGALDAASFYARSCGCVFSYDRAGREGLFLKSYTTHSVVD